MINVNSNCSCRDNQGSTSYLLAHSKIEKLLLHNLQRKIVEVVVTESTIKLLVVEHKIYIVHFLTT